MRESTNSGYKQRGGLEGGFRGSEERAGTERSSQSRNEEGCILLPVAETRRIWASPLFTTLHHFFNLHRRLKTLSAVKDTETAQSAKISVNSDTKRRKIGF